ncbi:MAG TPA: Ig-like domain-containing protein, partial [Kofleriaceae bacterium]
MKDVRDWFRVAVVWFALVGIALVGAACGNGSATRSPDAGAPDAPGDASPPNVTLTRLEVTPAHPSLPSGTMQPLTATGVFSNSTTRDLTSQVSWTSDAAAHATVSSAGVVAGVAPGTATITAAMGGISGATTVTVTDAVLASIALTLPAPSVPAGQSLRFTVTGTFSDATTLDVTEQASWASDTPQVATVSNTSGARGLVTTQAAGTTMIAATLGGMTAETRLTVTSAVLASIAVTPLDPSVPVGTTAQLIATGTFSDATTLNLTEQVTWASQTEASATVSNAAGSRGLAAALALGTARITATLDGISGATTLTVTDAVLVSISVTPVNPSVAA